VNATATAIEGSMFAVKEKGKEKGVFSWACLPFFKA